MNTRSFQNGNTQLLGLIGSNLSASHSFGLHNRAIQSQHRNAVYVPFQSTQSNWNALLTLDNFLGANVTMPHKEVLFSKMDELTDRAQTIGAINTIHKTNGQLIGDNTDSIGFLSAVQQYNIPWLERPIYILGAGGAAKAICYALHTVGVQNIYVWNRTPKRLQSLSTLIQGIQWWNIKEALPSNAIVIQCTSLGQQKEDPLPMQQWTSEHIVLDLIYHQTPLLKRVLSAGGTAINGIGMLIHQAAHSFARWFDCPPPISLMTQQFLHHYKTESST